MSTPHKGHGKLSLFAILIPLIFLGVGCVQDLSKVEPSTSKQDGTTVAEASGTALDMSGQGLRTVDAQIFRRSDVTSLDISDNALEGALPAEIRHMRMLRTLDASGNNMTGVPAEVGQLLELRILDLSDNQLTGLPYELGNLQKLELLDVSGNAYSAQDLIRIEDMLPETTEIRR